MASNVSTLPKTKRGDLREALGLIGKEIMVQFESLTLVLEVKNARQVWGRIDVLVGFKDLNAGFGEQWVSMDRIV